MDELSARSLGGAKARRIHTEERLEITQLVESVKAMLDDGHPCGSPAGDEWFAVMQRRLKALGYDL